MVALLDHFAIRNHEDAVRRAHGAQAVRDDEAGAAIERLLDGVLDGHFGFGVDGAGRLVQHKNRRVGQQRAGKGDQLLLPRGQAVAALAHVGVVALFKGEDEFLGVDHARGLFHFLIRGFQAAVTDVFADGAGQQVRLL